MAAADGEPVEAQQLIAAGLTLLARCPALVRRLSGKRAALLLPTSPAFLTALAAAEGRGAVLINPLASPAEVAYQIADADVGVVFTIAPLSLKLPEQIMRVLLDEAPRTARVVDGTHSIQVDLGSHAGLVIEGDSESDGRDEECAVVYTSAMAGRALGAILTHRGLIANARATIEAAGITSADHSLALLPFAHLFGLSVTLSAPLFAGARVTTMERFNASRAIELIRDQGVTLFTAVPSVFAALLAVLDRTGTALDAPALRVCICGGAPLAAELQDRWADATGVELRQGYGLTEASPVALCNRADTPNRHGMLGIPLPGVRVSIRDADTFATLDHGEPGEICVAGDGVFAGYVSGGEHGLAVQDGWLRTGDLGSADADGCVRFRGLLKSMFTRNGFNIYPREIGRVIGEMPGVRRVEVRAIPDAMRENDIAVDVLGDVAIEDVKSWCEAMLSVYKQPSEIRVRSS
ncbi:MAG: AMP-binding protein [Gemmatimonadota bacterium]|nr:AMP-binding protein [Gemmatimonadota bacterium]